MTSAAYCSVSNRCQVQESWARTDKGRVRAEAGQDRDRRVRADERGSDHHCPGLRLGQALRAGQQLQDERAHRGQLPGLLRRTRWEQRGRLFLHGRPGPLGRAPWRVRGRRGR